MPTPTYPQTDPGTGRIGAGCLVAGSLFNSGALGYLGMIAKLDSDGIVADDIDVTTFNSAYSAAAATNHFKSFIPGLKDPGTVSLDILYESSQYSTILQNHSVVQTWYIYIPGSNPSIEPGSDSTFQQNGYIKKLGLSVPVGDKMMMPVVLRMSGPIQFTVGSA